MLEKTARTPSGDPVQEKLRQDKANWNKEVSSFINDLIHLKKTMNGWPSKFFKERSRITQPIPADPATIIGSLAGDFQQLAQQGEAIAQEQLNYSKNRRQKQPKPTATPTAQAPVNDTAQPPAASGASPDLSKQLAAFEQKYGDSLFAEGSNKLTRTLTRTLNYPGSIGWGSNAKKRRARMNMLKRAATVYKMIGKLQVKIVAPLSGKQSIKDSYELLRTIKAEWALVEDSFILYKKENGEELSPDESKKEIEELKKQKGETPKEEKSLQKAEEEKEEIEQQSGTTPRDDIEATVLGKDVMKDYASVFKGRLGPEVVPILSGPVNKFAKEPSLTRADVARILLQQYGALLIALRAKYGVAGNSLKEIEAAIAAKEQAALPPGVTMPKNASEQMEVVAQDMIKKWLGKARHSVLPGDTSDYRINIFDMSKQLRQQVDAFMDLAESRKTTGPEYEVKIKEINSSISKMDAPMMRLYRLYFRVPKEMQGLI